MHQDTGSHPAPDAAPGDRNATPSDASQAAHLLEMAARDVDQWLAEARAEAAALVDAARAEAERLVKVAREEAEQLTTSARHRADSVLDGARTETGRIRAELDETKRTHEAEVAELQRLADDHRDHLRQHLTDLLGRIDGPRSEEPRSDEPRSDDSRSDDSRSDQGD